MKLVKCYWCEGIISTDEHGLSRTCFKCNLTCEEGIIRYWSNHKVNGNLGWVDTPQGCLVVKEKK